MNIYHLRYHRKLATDRMVVCRLLADIRMPGWNSAHWGRVIEDAQAEIDSYNAAIAKAEAERAKRTLH